MELSFFAPTGAMIQEYLDLNAMTEHELALELNITDGYMKKIMNGRMPLTNEIATDISYVFHIDSAYFIDYEKAYREFLAKKEN